jgi:hypothetical protein
MALGAVLLGLPLASNGQAWETIFAPSLTNYFPRAILVDPFSEAPAPPGILLGLGLSSGTTNNPNLLLLDRSNGTFTFNNSFPGYDFIHAFGFDPVSRTLYASIAQGIWDVRKSTDGISWTGLQTITNANARSFAVDEQGNLFVAGTDSLNSRAAWTIRKSPDQGQSWLIVDTVTKAGVSKLHFVPGSNAALFAVGVSNSSAAPGTAASWIVRRSRDAGATWNAVDTYTNPYGAYAYAITSDRMGNIYVAGHGNPSVVRSSSDGGNSWQTIHVNPTTGGFGMNVSDMVVDAFDNLFLAGYIFANLGHPVWAVHQRDAQGNWSTHLPFGNASSTLNSAARAIATDRAGNVLVAGSRQASAGARINPVVQQLAAPSLKATRFGDSLVITWPTRAGAVVLESKDPLTPASPWLPIATPPVIIGDQNIVTVEIDVPAAFYRLRKD